MDMFEYFTDIVSRLDIEDVMKFLSVLPMESLDFEEFLNPILTICLKGKNKEIAKIVLDWFSDHNPKEEGYPLITEVFGYKSFGNDLLEFISELDPDITIVTQFSNLIDWKDSSSQLYVAGKLLEIYNTIPISQIIWLYNFAQNNENMNLYSFLKEKVRGLNIPAETPDWMIDDTIPELDEFPTVNQILRNFDLPSDETAIEMLISVMGILGIGIAGETEGGLERSSKIAALKQVIGTDYIDLNEEDKRKTLEPYFEVIKLKELAEDPEYFRFFGPSNPQVGAVYDDKTSPCYLFGGCRMFLCSHNETYEDIDMAVDWFDHHCDYCNRYIESRFRAIRNPLKLGSWEGCYCSEDCLILDNRQDPENDPMDENMVRILVARLKRFGILDRPEGRILPIKKEQNVIIVENPKVEVINESDETDALLQLEIMLKNVGYSE